MGRWKIKWRATHCPHGHEFTPDNTRIGKKSGERICRTCARDQMARKREDPAFQARCRAAMQKYRDANRLSVNAAAVQRRRTRREWTEAFKCRFACGRCGERHPACLEFHHRDPGQKDENVSVALAHWSRERIEAEVAKCDVLCSNCHRKLHWQERASPDERERIEQMVRTPRRMLAGAARSAAITSCKRGHPFDDENTLMIQGKRRCRACHRDRSKASYHRLHPHPSVSEAGS